MINFITCDHFCLIFLYRVSLHSFKFCPDAFEYHYAFRPSTSFSIHEFQIHVIHSIYVSKLCYQLREYMSLPFIIYSVILIVKHYLFPVNDNKYTFFFVSVSFNCNLLNISQTDIWTVYSWYFIIRKINSNLYFPNYKYHQKCSCLGWLQASLWHNILLTFLKLKEVNFSCDPKRVYEYFAIFGSRLSVLNFL